MKISIITINYNNLVGLEKTMTSVLSQNYSTIEHIVIDGASTDGSAEFIKEHQERLAYAISEPDKGIYDAMNKGLKQVTGDYVYFLNSGDYLYDNQCLTQLFDKVGKKETPDIIYAPVLGFEEQRKVKLFRPFNKLEIFKQMLCHQGIIAHKSLFDQFGGFDTKYLIKADYDWLLRVLFGENQKIDVFRFEEPIAYYELGGLSETSAKGISAEEILEIRDKYYSKKEQEMIFRYYFSGRLKKLPMFVQTVISTFFRKVLIYKYPNLK